MLHSFPAVERALRHYADAYQPRSGSVIAAPGRSGGGSPMRDALLDDLDERAELRARLAFLPPEELAVVARWYGEGAAPAEIARGLRRSTRHVYRLRRSAIERLVDLGRPDEFADADLAEFA